MLSCCFHLANVCCAMPCHAAQPPWRTLPPRSGTCAWRPHRTPPRTRPGRAWGWCRFTTTASGGAWLIPTGGGCTQRWAGGRALRPGVREVGQGPGHRRWAEGRGPGHRRPRASGCWALMHVGHVTTNLPPSDRFLNSIPAVGLQVIQSSPWSVEQTADPAAANLMWVSNIFATGDAVFHVYGHRRQKHRNSVVLHPTRHP